MGINSSEFVKVSFDKSMNKVLQKAQLYVVVRFFDHQKQQPVVKYYSSQILGRVLLMAQRMGYI